MLAPRPDIAAASARAEPSAALILATAAAAADSAAEECDRLLPVPALAPARVILVD